MKTKLLSFNMLAIVACFTASSKSLIAQGIKQNQTNGKIVIGIVIDQMRWDYLYRYANRYSNDGFKRLLKGGFACQNTYINYVPSYTAPGHASIYTGSIPSLNGIVGNDWIENKQTTYCAKDTQVKSVGGSHKAGQMSPHNLLSNTIGDELRLSSNFKSRVYGIALKDRGAIFPAGHSANAAFWYDDSTGNFITSSYYLNELPVWLQKFNSKRWADTLLSHNWDTYYPINTYVQSINDDNPYEHLRKNENKPIFPHVIRKNDYKQLKSLPFGNTITFKFAKALIKGEELGTNNTDMLCISLSSTDYIGHTYAPNAVETEDTYIRLDLEMASFLRFLDNYYGKDNYTMFISADHGGAHNAQFLKDNKIQAGILSEYDISFQLKKQLKEKYNSDSILIGVFNYQIFLNEDKISSLNLNIDLVKDFIISYCKTYKGIAYAVDLSKIRYSSLPDALQTPILNGHYPARCGHIALIYKPAWYSDSDKGCTHGTWNPYDTHIPLIWYGKGVQKGETYKKYEITDIAATLSALLQIQAPNACIGQVIEKVVSSK